MNGHSFDCIEHFEVHSEAVKLLESIDNEIGVVTIAGPYRSGKSSLAGRAFLRNPKAFQAGSTVNACTKVRPHYSRLDPDLSNCVSIGPLDLRTASN